MKRDHRLSSHERTGGRRKNRTWRRVGFVAAFVLAFVMIVPAGGVVGLVTLHLLAWGMLMGVVWDGARPASEKASFQCHDCRYNRAKGEITGQCARTGLVVLSEAPACQNVRLKVSTV
jgi:hypothetical protein